MSLSESFVSHIDLLCMATLSGKPLPLFSIKSVKPNANRVVKKTDPADGIHHKTDELGLWSEPMPCSVFYSDHVSANGAIKLLFVLGNLSFFAALRH